MQQRMQPLEILFVCPGGLNMAPSACAPAGSVPVNMRGLKSLTDLGEQIPD